MDANRDGRCQLTLVEASGRPWRGVTFIRLENDSERVIFAKRARYHRPVTFTALRTPPRGRHLLHVKTECHSPITTYIHVTAQGATTAVVRLVLQYRLADACGHRIRFPTYGELRESRLGDLETALSDQHPPAFTPRHGPIRATSGPAYFDDLVHTRHTEHRHRRVACLFNLYAKMKRTPIDGNDGGRTAWDVVDQIFSLEEDRVFATVAPDVDMGRVLADLDTNPTFARHDSATHDIEPPVGYTKSDRTYKTTDPTGNLQLTFARKDGDGDGPAWVLDADIDEKTGVAHWGEVIYHTVTGARTNPYAVHQLLCLQGILPPYDLVTDAGRAVTRGPAATARG